MLPRAVRNNNPGNIDRDPDTHWQGTMPANQMDEAQAAEPRFVVFETPVWGFRAMLDTLSTYYVEHKLHTLAAIVGRWAPTKENDTPAYILDVSSRCGLEPDEPILYPDSLPRIAKGITTHESGCWEPYWHDADLDAAYRMLFGSATV